MPLVPAQHYAKACPGTTRPPGPSAKITQGARTLRQDPSCNLARQTPSKIGDHWSPWSRPSCWRQWPGRSGRALPPPRQPEPTGPEKAPDLIAAQLARRLGISRETVRRLAIAGALPHTVVCRGSRKTTRRFPRRFADDFAASGLDVADLAAFAAQWRARVTAPGQ